MKAFKTIAASVLTAAMLCAAAPAAMAIDEVFIVINDVGPVLPLAHDAAADYSPDDLEELARIIYWEARGEEDDGQLAVAQVVLNRVACPAFPDTIKGVVSQKNQFSPYTRGDYYSVSIPDDCYRSAERALSGEKVIGGDVVCFRAGSKPDTWYNTVYDLTIGNHHFYRLDI